MERNAIQRWRTGKPANCPDEINAKWPGITYPESTGCQARVVVDGIESSEYFAYSAFGHDVVRAHEAAARWVRRQRREQGPRKSTKGYCYASVHDPRESSTGIGGVWFIERYDARQACWRWAYNVGYGGNRSKTFGCGNEYTWSQARQDDAFERACAFRQRVEAEILTKRSKRQRAA